MPSLSSEQSASAVADLNKLLTNHNTKIIIYIRPPKDLLKSWYYEINKSTAPCRRFSQFVMLSPDYYILPIGSIHFWKKLVKPENIQILPYRDIGRGHIESFLQICGAEKIDIVDDFIINKSQASDKLERRRIDKVMAMKDKRERERYMARNMLESAAERKRLEKRIRHINREFSLFCEQHNIHLPCEDLTIDDVVAHEMAVNGNSKPLPQLVQWIRSFRYRPHVLRILRRIAGLYR